MFQISFAAFFRFVSVVLKIKVVTFACSFFPESSLVIFLVLYFCSQLGLKHKESNIKTRKAVYKITIPPKNDKLKHNEITLNCQETNGKSKVAQSGESRSSIVWLMILSLLPCH